MVFTIQNWMHPILDDTCHQILDYICMYNIYYHPVMDESYHDYTHAWMILLHIQYHPVLDDCCHQLIYGWFLYAFHIFQYWMTLTGGHLLSSNIG